MFSQTAVEDARNADLADYLKSNGHTLKKEGDQFRVVGTPGLVVVRNLWYNHVWQAGGNAIDYAMGVEGLHFTQAVAVLEKYACDHQEIDLLSPDEKHKKFKLPPKNSNCDRVISYLVEARGLPYDILHPYIIEGRIYEALGTHNCVFTGVEHRTGIVRYAFQRSSSPDKSFMFEAFGSEKKYSFSIPGANTLLIFESVIDLLSYKAMEPGKACGDAFWLSLGGLSAVPLYYTLSKWNGLEKIIFCLDRDRAADSAYEKYGWGLASNLRGFKVFRHSPVFKDWNEQLVRGGDSFPAPPEPWEVAP